MLKTLNFDKTNSESYLKNFLGKRKSTQKNLSFTVNKIIKEWR